MSPNNKGLRALVVSVFVITVAAVIGIPLAKHQTTTPSTTSIDTSPLVLASSTKTALTSFATSSSEEIKDFTGTYTVQPDGTVIADEVIVYSFGDQDKHGIYRDIPYTRAAGTRGRLILSQERVTDEKGNSYGTDISTSDDPFNPGEHIRIGDPDLLISGVHLYRIQYLITHALGYFSDRDELYWNVTGNGWDVPIEHVSARVILPGNIATTSLQLANYCGTAGQKGSCSTPVTSYDAAHNQTVVLFTANRSFNANEGMTVAVGFPHGTVPPPSRIDQLLYYLRTFGIYVVPFVIAALWFRKSAVYWFRRRRYYRNNPLVAEYDAQGATPIEVAAIMEGAVLPKYISAEIISLAVRGFLTISKTDGEYSFEATKADTASLEHYDKLLLEGVAGSTQSALIDTFYATVGSIAVESIASLQIRGYFDGGAKIRTTQYSSTPRLAYLFVGFFLAINPGIFIWGFSQELGLMFSGTCVLIALIGAIFHPRNNRLTDKGLELERRFRGLKLYIDMAEQERIRFSDAPSKDPKTFETLLPFAMVFGMEKEWAKQFESIYTTPPSWYHDSSMSAFSTGYFIGNMQSFSSTTQSTLSSSYSMHSTSSSGWSGGSGGGGSSGGGGGGGGGGSW